jgi:lipopolysaccharide export system protein LptC
MNEPEPAANETPKGGINATAERWTNQVRSSAVDALRYTRFVTLMRRMLPLAAAGILGVVIAYALLPGRSDRVSLSYQKTGTIEGDLSMNKPRLTGTDAHGNPFVITADEAIQEGRNAHRATLMKVDARLTFNTDRWATAKAGKGYIDLDAKRLHLSDGIAMFTDNGYRLHTDNAFADLDKNTIEGKTQVTGWGPLGSVSADTFFVDRDNRKLTLQGNVHTTLNPRKVKK